MRKKPGPKTESGIDGDLANVTYTVDALTRRMLKVLGGGNESKGLRAAARTAYRIYQHTPTPGKAPADPS